MEEKHRLLEIYDRGAGKLKSFLRENRLPLVVSVFLLILGYYRFMTSGNYRIDSAIMLVDPRSYFNDLSLGRYGIVILHQLLNLRLYNPQYIAWLSLIMLGVNGVSLVYFIRRASGCAGKWLTVLSPLLLFLHPVWTEQLYFSFQSFLILLCFFFCQLAAHLIHARLNGGRKYLLYIAVLLAFAAFSVYQTFPICFTAFAVALNLADVLAHEEKATGKYLLRCLGLNVLVFSVAMVLYLVGNSFASVNQDQTNYLSRQILWGSVPFFGAILNIFKSIWSLIVAQGATDSLSYVICLLFSLVMFSAYLIVRRDRKMKAALAGAWLFLNLMPFAMIVLMTRRPQLHSDLAVPLTNVLNLWIAAVCAGQLRINVRSSRVRLVLIAGTAVAAAVSLSVQAPISFRLQYTDDVRYHRDHDLGMRLISSLEEAGAGQSEKPVIYVGQVSDPLPDTCISADVIGISMFEFHEDAMQTNLLLADLLELLGRDYPAGTQEQLEEAHILAEEMPDYPLEGSILETDDFYVVRLSEDPYWAWESLTAGMEQVPDFVLSVPESPSAPVPAPAPSDGEKPETGPGGNPPDPERPREENLPSGEYENHTHIAPENEEPSDLRPENAAEADAIGTLETLACDDTAVTMEGFAVIRYVPASEVTVQVFLVDQVTGEAWRVNSATVIKRNITRSYWSDGISYDQCGFQAICPAELFSRNRKSFYQVVLRCSWDDQTLDIATDTLLNYHTLTREPPNPSEERP